MDLKSLSHLAEPFVYKLLFQREPRMDPLKVEYLSGKELPDAALIKTLLVASGEQGAREILIFMKF